MSPIEIAELIFEDAWNRQEFGRVRTVLADEFPLHIGGDTRITSADELEGIVSRWHTSFPDFRFDVHSITAGDGIVAVHATLNGTHEGRWGDLEATGRTVTVDHAFFFRVDDGRVVEMWEILDRSALVAQLTGD